MTDTDSLRGQTLVYFGPEPWDGMWRNRHQLMSRFAKDNTVLYVEPPVSLKETLRNRLSGRPDNRPILRSDPTGVQIVSRSERIPLTGTAPLRQLSYWNLRRLLEASIGRLGGGKPIVWVSRPNHQPMADLLDAELRIYHVVDEYTGYLNMTPNRKAVASWLEAQLLKSVDLAITVSASLQRDKSRHNPSTYLVPNAVDFESYRQADAENVPEFLQALSRPVIGYSGLVGARLDLDLIRETAMKRPDWSFVLLGDVNPHRCGESLERLRLMSNVHFPGCQPSTRVPAWVAGFDACILPYALDTRARHSSPLKLYEYAAAGKPIVSTDVPAARENDMAEIIIDSGQFVGSLERVLTWPDNHPRLEHGRRVAEQNTWDHRVRQLSRIMNAALAGAPLAPETGEACP